VEKDLMAPERGPDAIKENCMKLRLEAGWFKDEAWQLLHLDLFYFGDFAIYLIDITILKFNICLTLEK
jgi:hypothetical protein